MFYIRLSIAGFPDLTHTENSTSLTLSFSRHGGMWRRPSYRPNSRGDKENAKMTKRLFIRRALGLSVCSGLLAFSSARAQTKSEEYAWPGFAVGVKVGTLGLGADLSLPIVPNRLNVRLSGDYLNYSYDGTIDDIDYKLTLDFKTAMLLADWHPFANHFRLSAGVVRNGSKVKLDGTPTDDVEIGDHDYPPELVDTLTGQLDFEDVAPYVGIGFGNAIGSYEQTWSFVFDLGVILQTFDATLQANGPISNDPTFQEDLKKQEKDLQDSLDQFKIYPVLQFGVAYHF
jgi:hypothetical protein